MDRTRAAQRVSGGTCPLGGLSVPAGGSRKKEHRRCDLAYNFAVPQYVNRRNFLRGAGATLLTLSAAEAAAAVPVIDTHIHFYDPRRKDGIPWPPSTDTVLYKPVLPPLFASTATPVGVTGAVVIEASPRLEDNQWVLDLVKGNPMIVAYVAYLEAGTPAFRTGLERFRKNPLTRGIRLFDESFVAGVAKPAFMEDLKRLADADLSLDAIGEADTKWLAPLLTVAEKVPNLRIVINHMPEAPPGWKADQIRALAKHPQVCCKVSGVLKTVGSTVPTDVGSYRAVLDQLWEMFGPDRVMYGSNWPKSDHMAPYAKVFSVVKQYVDPKGAAASEKFFSKNSKAFYKWLDRT
jgi:L-fuconolactonase